LGEKDGRGGVVLGILVCVTGGGVRGAVD